MNLCPCGTSKDYHQCCEPIHRDHSLATTPEQLMRSRYSAHVKGLVEFVIDTYHPSCEAGKDRAAIIESIESEWSALEVIQSEASDNADEGFVTFKAYFIQDGQTYCLEERSRFIKHDQCWYYIDGTFPHTSTDQSSTKAATDPRLNQTVKNLKVGRNDPCLCGSGKKFKKCCA